MTACGHCASPVDLDVPASVVHDEGCTWADSDRIIDCPCAGRGSDGGKGSDGDLVWCSEVCRQVVVDGLWPSPVGPASHDDILGWIAEDERLHSPPAPLEEPDGLQADR